MTRRRAVIVEDEPLARRSLRDHLATVSWIDVVGEAADGATALRLLDELRPDILFLDVRLPELSGVEILRRMAGDPAIVFTTAYEQFAVSAFELGAVDYLVKPFGRERFLRAMDRMATVLERDEERRSTAERARSTLREGTIDRLFVRSGDRIVPVAAAGILRAEAAGDYVEIHTGSGSHLLRITLEELELRLDSSRFLRVHRSHLVNLDHVTSMTGHEDRRLRIRLADGSIIVASRVASARLRDEAR